MSLISVTLKPIVPTLFSVIFTYPVFVVLNQTFSIDRDSLILFTLVDNCVFKICWCVERLEFDQATMTVPKTATAESIIIQVTTVLNPLLDRP